MVNVLDLVAEDAGQFVFSVHQRHESLANKNLATGQGESIDEIGVRDVVELVVELAMGVGGHAPSYGVHVFFDWAVIVFIESMAVMGGHGIPNFDLFFIGKAHHLGYGMADFFLRFGGGVEHRFRPDVVWDSMPLAP